MKLSENWLREWVNPELTTEQLVEQITMAGLEVDAVEAVAGEFSGVIVGEILSVEQHPDADKLRVCQVAGGETVAQVVCGAPNARQGIKIPFATVGALLPPGEDGKPFKIKKAKLRGVESFGMLCAQTELQLGDDDAGLWELPLEATVGKDLREYLNLNDQCIEVDLTPNRSDCLSLKGIARDVGVLNRVSVNEPAIEPVATVIDETVSVTLNADSACSRYIGRIIRNVDVSKPSPLWLQEKLRRSGLRSIDAVVDVTNYVLIELGQPMHAFDLQRLEGGINVRLAEQGETLKLLDDQDVTLNSDTLVIADGKGPVAMAGIMGGAATAVSESTQDILLESAFFNPIAIAGRARSYGLHTDSSHRFERGVDYNLQEQAIERATALLLDIVGGDAGPVSVTENNHVPCQEPILLRRSRIKSGLGFDMADDEVLDILSRLGLELLDSTSEGWRFKAPSYRFDLAIEEDLLEELARIYGYNRLPTTSLTADLTIAMQAESAIGLNAVRHQLVARGYQEAITYSFVDPKLQSMFADENAIKISLKNPISADMAEMRTSLWPGLVHALQHNVNRQQSRVRMFESGMRFLASDKDMNKVTQEPVLAGLIYGSRLQESWSESTTVVDFFDIKGDLESVLELTAEQRFEFKAAKHPALHPGQSAQIEVAGEVVGYIGAMHPQLQKQLGLVHAVYLFEITQQAIAHAKLPSFQPLSKFPEVRRDIAVVVDQSVAVSDLQSSIRHNAGDSLQDLKVFDVYVGKGIDPQRKSVALGLTFQHPSRTLNEDEINASMDVVVKALEGEYQASLR